MLLVLPSALAQDPSAAWRALAAGNLEAARAGFAAPGELALAGRLWLAATEGDRAAIAALLRGVNPRRASDEVVIAAAQALRLETRTRAARPWLRQACEVPVLDARTLCALAPIWEEMPRRSVCQGCEDAVVPLSYLGAQPLVAVSVDGGPPLPFIVDTGATTSLVSRSLPGLTPRADTRTDLRSSVGTMASWLDVVSIGVGGMEIDGVQVAVADLPQGVAGLLSPQDVWPDRAVTLDFAGHELRIGAVAEGVVLPYRHHDLRPYLEVYDDERPSRPVILDTGAWWTSLEERWEALGTPLVRAGAAELYGAGGTGTTASATDARWRVGSGTLGWVVVDPLITPSGVTGRGPAPVGLLGADFWMGRAITLDPAAGRLVISQPQLPAWPVGASARFRVTGEVTGTFEERVVGDASGTEGREVVLDVRIDTDRGSDALRLTVDDDWWSRGAWMSLRRPDLPAAVRGWSALMVSFSTTSAVRPPDVSLTTLMVGDERWTCTVTRVPSVRAGTPATLETVECPRDPWRTQRATLIGSDGTVYWEMARER